MKQETVVVSDSISDSIWVLEYSDLSKAADMFPYHIQTMRDSQKGGPSKLNWQVVFIGLESECYDEMHRRLGD